MKEFKSLKNDVEDNSRRNYAEHVIKMGIETYPNLSKQETGFLLSIAIDDFNNAIRPMNDEQKKEFFYQVSALNMEKEFEISTIERFENGRQLFEKVFEDFESILKLERLSQKHINDIKRHTAPTIKR